MNTLPDFTTAPAWLDAAGNTWVTNDIVAEVGPGCIAESNAPWTPLRTDEDWASRVNLDKLAKILADRDNEYDPGVASWDDLMRSDPNGLADEYRKDAAAVIAGLPELTKEEA